MNFPERETVHRLEALLAQTEVLGECSARIGDDCILADTLFYPPTADEPPIVTPLQSALYQRFYCHLPDAEGSAEEESTDSEGFLLRLRAANQGVERWSAGWAMHPEMLDGQTIVFSGEVVHIADPTDLKPQQGGNGEAAEGAAVRFRVERVSTETGFYFAHGETPTDALDRKLVTRLYFNLSPDGAEEWLRLVTGRFNRGQVPFTLKCPLLPQAFRRSDSCVLYVSRRHLSAALGLIEQFLPALEGRLRPSIPMFSESLVPGIGLADDPGTGESFGQHRMRLVARALCRVGPSAALEQKRQAVTTEFVLHGLSLERPHLNAGAVEIPAMDRDKDPSR